MVDLEELTQYYLQALLVAGDYACRIQKSVGLHDAKEGMDNAFSQALTDADLSVQNYIEICTLAKYPQFAFYGEEDDQSLNKKYFPDSSEYILSVDPINGTLYYKDNLPYFDIILTLTKKGELIWVLSYMPRKELIYYAIKGQGTVVLSTAKARERRCGRALKLNAGPGVVLTFRAKHLVDALSPKINIVDNDKHYDPAKPGYTVNGIFEGGISGFAIEQAHIIDWGAYAFLVREAGGFATDFKGAEIPNAYDFPRCRVPSLIVATTRPLHEQMISLLNR